MGSQQPPTDFRSLDVVLGAIGQGIAQRIEAQQQAGALRAAPVASDSRVTCPLETGSLRRGISLEVVTRATVRHFLPGAAAIVFVPIVLLRLMDPYDWITVAGPVGVLLSVTVGFGLSLGALSRWLYPHANPAGRLSDVSGLIAPIVTLFVGLGLSSFIAPLPSLSEYLAIFVVAMVSAAATALAVFLPWLRPTRRVGRLSSPHRWIAFRATVATGFVGAGVFGIARLLRVAYLTVAEGWRPWRNSWQVFTEVALGGFFTGFVIGIVFATAVRVLYRRSSAEQLNPLKVGLWGATLGTLPLLGYVWPWITGGAQGPIDPIGALLATVVSWSLPSFLLVFGAVLIAKHDSTKSLGAGPEPRSLSSVGVDARHDLQ